MRHEFPVVILESTLAFFQLPRLGHSLAVKLEHHLVPLLPHQQRHSLPPALCRRPGHSLLHVAPHGLCALLSAGLVQQDPFQIQGHAHQMIPLAGKAVQNLLDKVLAVRGALGSHHLHQTAVGLAQRGVGQQLFHRKVLILYIGRDNPGDKGQLPQSSAVLHSGEQLFPVALFHQLGSQGEPSPLAKGVQRLIEGQKALLSLLAVQKIPQHPVHKQLSDLGAKPLVHDRVKAHGKAGRL